MSGSFRHVWRATFTLHKKKGISDEEFKDHYTKIHAPMFVNNVGIKHGVLDYNLVSGWNVLREHFSLIAFLH